MASHSPYNNSKSLNNKTRRSSIPAEVCKTIIKMDERTARRTRLSRDLALRSLSAYEPWMRADPIMARCSTLH
jgi:hypothetical protein